MLLNPHAFGGSASLKYLGVRNTIGADAGQTVISVDDAPFGVASSERYVFAVILGIAGVYNPAVTLSSATIGGVPASIAVQQSYRYSPSFYYTYAIISALVTTGTSGVVEATFSNNVFGFYCHTVRVFSFDGGAAHDTANELQLWVPDLSVTVDVPKAGFLIAGSCCYSSGIMSITDGVEKSHSYLNQTPLIGFGDGLASETGRTVKVENVSGSQLSHCGLIVASFG